MSYAKCKEILRRYFSDIVYIDDEFDLCLVKDILSAGHPEDFIEVPLSTNNIDISEPFSVEAVSARTETHPLVELLMELNKSPYTDVRLTPVLFESAYSVDLAIAKMLTAPLSIIDWDLRSGQTAYDVIKKLFEKTTQLKVIVVYTKSFDEARSALDTSLGDGQYRLTPLIDIPGKVKCVQCANESLVLVASKDLKLNELLDIIVDCFLDTCGTMPVALLDLAAQIEKRSGELFASFRSPLDGLYFLQSHYSGEDKYAFQNTLTTFLLNRVEADVSVDLDIIGDIYRHMQNRLAEVAGMDDGALTRLLDLFIKKTSSKSKNLENILPEDYKASAKDLLGRDFDRWQDVLDAFMLGVEKNKFAKELKNELWPLFVQLLISGESLLNYGAELIINLKYHSCPTLPEPESEISGFEEKDLFIKSLRFGDIFVDGKNSRHLLCITPPCDIFRLKEKTNLNISYIVGRKEEIDKQPDNKKEGSHICVYPGAKDENGNRRLEYICWSFYENERFDLNDGKGGYEEIRSYAREYRLDEQYARQIANKYIAYCSRAGVNELFIEDITSLRGIWN